MRQNPAIADAGAEDRRDLDKTDFRWQVSDEVGIRQSVLGETAVDRVAGVLLRRAERFPPAEAVPAVAAGTVEPSHADTVAFLNMGHA